LIYSTHPQIKSLLLTSSSWEYLKSCSSSNRWKVWIRCKKCHGDRWRRFRGN
jgi:hypothetical protein